MQRYFLLILFIGFHVGLIRSAEVAEVSQKENSSFLSCSKWRSDLLLNLYASNPHNYQLIHLIYLEVQKLFTTAQELIQADTIKIEDLFPLIGCALAFPCTEQTVSEQCLTVLKFLAKNKPWTFESTEYGTANSVFDAFVLIVSKQKKKSPLYPRFYKNALYLISVLSQEGFKGTVEAAERARNLELEDLAEAIFPSPKKWDIQLKEFDKTREKAEPLFKEVRRLLSKGEASLAEATDVLSLALFYSDLEESRLLLEYAANCKPFVLRKPFFQENASLFHFIVFSAGKFKQNNLYKNFLNNGGKGLILSLIKKGVTDTMMGPEKKTAYKLACDLGLDEIAKCLENAHI